MNGVLGKWGDVEQAHFADSQIWRADLRPVTFWQVSVSSPQIRQPFYVPFPSSGHLWPCECLAAATASWRCAFRLESPTVLTLTNPSRQAAGLRVIVEGLPCSLVRVLSLRKLPAVASPGHGARMHEVAQW